MSDAERDAWLREALRHAPDADARPPSGVSEAILSKARAQARGRAPARARPARASAANGLAAFWDWLARPPVAAGFASVMAATLVGLMWWDRPMDEAMPRAPALTAERNDAAPPLASAAPASPAAPPAPAIEAAKPTPPTDGKATAKEAAADDSEVQRRQGSALKPSADADAKIAEPAATAQKREQLAKERAPVAEAKNETPAPFATAPARREAQSAGSLDGAATDPAKKADASRRSRAIDAVEPAPPPAAAQSIAPSARPAPPDVATAPAAPPLAARAATTTTPAQAAPAPFSELAQRQRAGGDLRAKDAAGFATPAPSEAVAPSNSAQRKEAERAQVDKAQASESTPAMGAAASAVTAARPKTTARADSPSRSDSVVASMPLAHLLATIGADPARWSRQTAAGQTVALDAAWRGWLSELDAASAGRWRRLDGGAASPAETDTGRDGADGATTLRLFSDGRLAAVIRVDAGIVQLDAAPGARSERWQAALGPADAARLRTTSRRLPP